MPEVVIVGAGLVGCLTAIGLADAGIGCTILDEGTGDRSASHTSAGGIYLQLQPVVAAPERVRQHARKLAPLVRATLPAWLRLAARLPAIGLRRTGGLIVGLDEADLPLIASKSAMEGALGLESEMLSGRDIRALSPDFSREIPGGCYVPNEGHCEPATLMRTVRDELDRLGVRVRARRSVDRFEQRPDGVRLRLRGGEWIDAQRAVLATGGFTGDMLDRLGIRHGIRAFPIQMYATAPTPIRVPALVRAFGRRLSIKQLDTGEVWVGGGWDAAGYDRRSGRTSISSVNEQHNRATASAVVPGLASLAVDRRWGGRVAWTHDGLPVIGHCPCAPDVLLACGGNGFSLAPLYAELLTSLIPGRLPALDLADFDAERFANACPDAAEAVEIAPD